MSGESSDMKADCPGVWRGHTVREGQKIPLIMTQCNFNINFEMIEGQGVDEIGEYEWNGATGDCFKAQKHYIQLAYCT